MRNPFGFVESGVPCVDFIQTEHEEKGKTEQMYHEPATIFMRKYREALAISAHNLIKAARIRSSRYGAKKYTRKKYCETFFQSEEKM